MHARALRSLDAGQRVLKDEAARALGSLGGIKLRALALGARALVADGAAERVTRGDEEDVGRGLAAAALRGNPGVVAAHDAVGKEAKDGLEVRGLEGEVAALAAGRDGGGHAVAVEVAHEAPGAGQERDGGPACVLQRRALADVGVGRKGDVREVSEQVGGGGALGHAHEAGLDGPGHFSAVGGQDFVCDGGVDCFRVDEETWGTCWDSDSSGKKKGMMTDYHPCRTRRRIWSWQGKRAVVPPGR
jgi:hypothetical protein